MILVIIIIKAYWLVGDDKNGVRLVIAVEFDS
jgi:hypothetical protein